MIKREIICLKKDIVFDTKELDLWYGEDQALKNINLRNS